MEKHLTKRQHGKKFRFWVDTTNLLQTDRRKRASLKRRSACSFIPGPPRQRKNPKRVCLEMGYIISISKLQFLWRKDDKTVDIVILGFSDVVSGEIRPAKLNSGSTPCSLLSALSWTSWWDEIHALFEAMPKIATLPPLFCKSLKFYAGGFSRNCNTMFCLRYKFWPRSLRRAEQSNPLLMSRYWFLIQDGDADIPVSTVSTSF